MQQFPYNVIMCTVYKDNSPLCTRLLRISYNMWIEHTWAENGLDSTWKSHTSIIVSCRPVSICHVCKYYQPAFTALHALPRTLRSLECDINIFDPRLVNYSAALAVHTVWVPSYKHRPSYPTNRYKKNCVVSILASISSCSAAIYNIDDQSDTKGGRERDQQQCVFGCGNNPRGNIFYYSCALYWSTHLRHCWICAQRRVPVLEKLL